MSYRITRVINSDRFAHLVIGWTGLHVGAGGLIGYFATIKSALEDRHSSSTEKIVITGVSAFAGILPGAGCAVLGGLFGITAPISYPMAYYWYKSNQR
jgi:hypothetical protein